MLIFLQQDPIFGRLGNDNGGLRTILGQFDGELLHNADRVVVSPGVPLQNYGLSSLLQLVSSSVYKLYVNC